MIFERAWQWFLVGPCLLTALGLFVPTSNMNTAVLWAGVAALCVLLLSCYGIMSTEDLMSTRATISLLSMPTAIGTMLTVGFGAVGAWLNGEPGMAFFLHPMLAKLILCVGAVTYALAIFKWYHRKYDDRVSLQG